VILDTNVLVSGLAYPASISGRIVGLSREGALDVALSRYILDETARVVLRLSRIQLNAAEILDLVDSLMFLADIVEPSLGEEPSLRDAADQKVLGILVAAKAGYLRLATGHT
jgi:putative PIN family toxin of toxin-antitoxin system